MGEKLYYFTEVLIFTLIALYFLFKPQDALRVLKLEDKKGLSVIVRTIAVAAAVVNVIINMNKLF